MSTPIAPDPTGKRAKLSVSRGLLAAALAAALAAGVFLMPAAHPTLIGLCTMQNPGDSVPTEYAHVLGTDSMFVMDSTAWAHVDSASLPPSIVEPKCDVIKHPPADSSVPAPTSAP